MRAHTETLLDQFATLEALLCREAGGDFDHLMTSSYSLIFKDLNERSPTGVGDAFRQRMVLEQVIDMQLLNTDMGIALCVGFGSLEEEIAPLAFDLQMRLGAVASSLASATAPLLAAAQLALLAT